MRTPESKFQAALESGEIILHPFILGELALGRIPRRSRTLSNLSAPPQLDVAPLDRVLALIDEQALAGTGVGYIDAHLLASCLLAPGTMLWTRDRRLDSAARRLSVAVELS